jgi:hypothetical protein
MPIAGLRPVAVIGRGRVKTICEKCKWEMHAKFRLESVKKWGIECKFRIVFKRMWEIFYRQCQYSEFSHGLGRRLPPMGISPASALEKTVTQTR